MQAGVHRREAWKALCDRCKFRTDKRATDKRAAAEASTAEAVVAAAAAEGLVADCRLGLRWQVRPADVGQ